MSSVNCALSSAGVSAAVNELRPCAPVSLKHVLAQEVVKGLQAVSDSLIRYNAIRVLRGNESTLVIYAFQTDFAFSFVLLDI